MAEYESAQIHIQIQIQQHVHIHIQIHIEILPYFVTKVLFKFMGFH